jgi:peroxiredoxin
VPLHTTRGGIRLMRAATPSRTVEESSDCGGTVTYRWHRTTRPWRALGCDGRRDGTVLSVVVGPRSTASPACVAAKGLRDVADALVGREMPSVVLGREDGIALNLGEFSRGFPLAIYLYPAIGASREGIEDTRPLDAAQHRAFRDCRSDFEARGYRALGVSNLSPRSQAREIFESRLSHMLLSDPQLHLAEALDLPTVTVGGVRRYRRLTLIVRRGVSEKAFYPVDSAPRSAAQVITWIKLQVAC